ncbi:hypothetical protein GOBAR_AA09876 [Gossypium barbadense]|uniref:Uncharacterized protein n=1 Tax=Gossypium barbadense TaxID=3634 RepID=A0A2P5Y575_GOSBA|nr:hypothetical protein GOBAR_AA09876 [Gossypium barbadense]
MTIGRVEVSYLWRCLTRIWSEFGSLWYGQLVTDEQQSFGMMNERLPAWYWTPSDKRDELDWRLFPVMLDHLAATLVPNANLGPDTYIRRGPKKGDTISTFYGWCFMSRCNTAAMVAHCRSWAKEDVATLKATSVAALGGAIADGIEEAWRGSYKKVIIKSYCREVVKLVTNVAARSAVFAGAAHSDWYSADLGGHSSTHTAGRELCSTSGCEKCAKLHPI